MQDFLPTPLGRLVEVATRLLPGRVARSIRWRYFRWARAAAEVGLDVEAIGFRWRLHPADNLTERLIWLNREHPEAQSLDWALAALRGKRSLIVDIGANCGAFAVPLTAAAGPGSRSLAFEPNPRMLKRLKANLHLNALTGRVEVHPVALGSATGEAVLSFSRNLGEATLRAGAAPDAQQVRVPVRPLSDYLSEAAGYEVVFLKIDVEGYEPEVLAPFFAAASPDLWPTHILIETEHSADWSSDLSALLAAQGYATVGMQDGNSFLERRRQWP